MWAVASRARLARERAFCDPYCLRRYLRATTWKVDKSFARLLDTLQVQPGVGLWPKACASLRVRPACVAVCSIGHHVLLLMTGCSMASVAHRYGSAQLG